MKSFIINSFLILFSFYFNNTLANNTSAEAEKFLTWVEYRLPEMLTPSTQTQNLGEFCLRHYPGDPEIYVGVVCQEGGSFTSGDVYALIGTELQYLGQLSQYAPLYNESCVGIPLNRNEGRVERSFMTIETDNLQPIDQIITTEWLSVSDAEIKTKLTTDIDLGAGVENSATSTIITSKYQNIEGNYWHFSDIIETTISIDDSIFKDITTIIIDPPVQRKLHSAYCNGHTWNTEGGLGEGFRTSLNLDQFNEIDLSSLKTKTTVKSINQTVIVPAGIFDTVEIFSETMGDGGISMEMTYWISKTDGVTVKSEINQNLQGQKLYILNELFDLK